MDNMEIQGEKESHCPDLNTHVLSRLCDVSLEGEAKGCS
jgi:hypothetical protein